MTKTGLGLRAQKGGAVAVAVAVRDGEPVIISATILATCAAGDRLSFEPYRMAFETAQAASGDDPAVVAEEGRRRQDELAETGLKQLTLDLGGAPVAGLLANRAGWVADLLSYSLAFAEHVPVAEGLAVRDALRFGLHRNGIETVELDEKSLIERAEKALARPAADIEARLKAMGTGRKPWRKEQKLAALAGWLAAIG